MVCLQCLLISVVHEGEGAAQTLREYCLYQGVNQKLRGGHEEHGQGAHGDQHFLVFNEEDKCVHQQEELNHAYGKGCKVTQSAHNIPGVSAIGDQPVVFDYIDICPCFNFCLLQ